MHRVLTIPASATHPERYAVEELQGDTWRMIDNLNGTPYMAPSHKVAVYVAQRLDAEDAERQRR